MRLYIFIGVLKRGKSIILLESGSFRVFLGERFFLREQGARCRGLFVVGVGGGREWEGELGVGGMCFRINALRAMLSSP
jgi:hypothetical protein